MEQSNLEIYSKHFNDETKNIIKDFICICKKNNIDLSCYEANLMKEIYKNDTLTLSGYKLDTINFVKYVVENKIKRQNIARKLTKLKNNYHTGGKNYVKKNRVYTH